MGYWVYMLRSEKDRSFYIGYTSNLENRVKKHQLGYSRYTRTKRPWKLVYFETFDLKSEAIKRERFLKDQKNTTFYESLIKNWSGSSVG
ncbi:GIY-YIG nuclease family protein [Ekhidna sp.]|uniref:GIY-YIG nuclease family protein n=2 Tax=Ekhidna sp. TaxID=2608089 RepID=UPI003C7A9002